MRPTPKAQWVKTGDRCLSPSGAVGTVLAVRKMRSGTQAKVQWDRVDHLPHWPLSIAWHTITLLTKEKS